MIHCPQLPQLKQGENIGYCPGPWANPQTESSKLWYAEKKDWYGGVVREQGFAAIGHYTQVRELSFCWNVDLMLSLFNR